MNDILVIILNLTAGLLEQATNLSIGIGGRPDSALRRSVVRWRILMGRWIGCEDTL